MTPTLSTPRVHSAKLKRVYIGFDWYAIELHRGVANYARKVGWALDVRSLRGATPTPTGLRYDGMVCLLSEGSTLHEYAKRANFPTVTIGAVPLPRIPNVRPDESTIAKMAADHFIGRGFRHFAFYVMASSAAEASRLHHFREQLTLQGFALHVITYREDQCGTPLSDEHLRWLGDSLKSLPKPLAVMAEYDDPAMDLIDACVFSGLRVPEEVAILGCDNDALRCDFAPVPLSSIDTDQFNEGYRAAEILDHMMQGRKPQRRVTRIPAKTVVTRKSTDILAVEHKHVAMALRHIWDHYTEPITAAHIASDIPMSARRLHDAFMKHIGRSITAEISRKRVEHAKQLLGDTDKKAWEIAQLSGFRNIDRMGKVFKRWTGEPPSHYRRRSRGRATG